MEVEERSEDDMEFKDVSVGGEIRKSLTAPELSDLEVVISIDNTPVLSPVNMEPNKEESEQKEDGLWADEVEFL